MIVLGSVHHSLTAIAGLALGLAFAVATACMNKGLEIAVILRMPDARARAVLGFMSWMGYAMMMAPFFLINANLVKLAAARACARISSAGFRCSRPVP